jgi:hypothetical protein
MSKTLYLRVITGFLLIGIGMACRVFTQISKSETETPVTTTSPVRTKTSAPTASPIETDTLEPAATEFIAPATATPKFAPFCEPSSASIITPTPCQRPIAEQSSSFCSSKVPYNLVLINAGSTYETLNENFRCSDGGMKDGKQILTCTGPMSSPFELRVCDPACAAPKFQTEITHCPEDFIFDELQGCCTKNPQLTDQSCVLLKLQTQRCVTGCTELINQSDCEENFYVCEWDYENKVCLNRK